MICDATNGIARAMATSTHADQDSIVSDVAAEDGKLVIRNGDFTLALDADEAELLASALMAFVHATRAATGAE